MRIPENYDKVVEEIKAYAQDHSQVNYFDVDNGNLIYEKKELLLERSKTKLLYVASAAGNIIIMLLCGIFVLSIKMECDFPETEWKYRFYIQSGMSSAKVRKGIIKECLLSGGLPVICGTNDSKFFSICKESADYYIKSGTTGNRNLQKRKEDY